MGVPKLALDRPFTYVVPDDVFAGTGSLVSVPFHGRTVDGWILGAAREGPDERLLPIRKVRSQVRFFDERRLELLRWVSERYITPLCTVIERSHPPRVVSEEEKASEAAVADAPPRAGTSSLLAKYGGPDALQQAGATTWLRPLPTEEAEVCVAAVANCLSAGRPAIVLVPEAEPIPFTALAVLDRFERRACAFMGGDARSRYRGWLDIRAGRYDVVVSTRPGVFAPLTDVGLIWISREVHPGHREDRAPYYHVRDVAMARARLEGAACVLSSMVPSVETATASSRGAIRIARPSRSVERTAAPLVETTTPGAEDRSVRLTQLLKTVRSAALIVSRRGYGVARACRSCGEPAACHACGGPITAEAGDVRCAVCDVPGECAHCGGRSFGVERGGVERVAEWARGRSSTRVVRADDGTVPLPDAITVGTAATVKDVGPLALDLVAILDADRAVARAGIHAGEQALATWAEAAAWTGARRERGRVLVQTRRPAHPAVQALIRWEPVPFLLSEAERRNQAGFPPGHPVFRIEGIDDLAQTMKEAGAESVLATTAERGTVCLVAVAPEQVVSFRNEVVRLAAKGTVTRVEAEPQV